MNKRVSSRGIIIENDYVYLMFIKIMVELMKMKHLKKM